MHLRLQCKYFPSILLRMNEDLIDNLLNVTDIKKKTKKQKTHT